MCGIAGYVDYSKKTLPSLISKMTDSISYRGPDSSGEYISRSNVAGLGIRRLSIIDLKTGDQPIKNEDGNVVVVYNGEIYNFQNLKQHLKKRGHKFTTNSDTEVLVHGYEEWDVRIADKLNGMYAFAIWDESKKQLILGRDRAGIKPLYYYYDKGVFIFASEIKSIVKHPYVKKNIDLSALSLYCYFGFVPGKGSIFKDIHKLLPGHILIINKKGINTKKYFEVRTDFDVKDLSLDELLDRSVKTQLNADVPVGIFLSGGLDSSLISYYVTKYKKLKSFSIGFNESSFDESNYARKVAKLLGTDHYEDTFSVNDAIISFSDISKKLDEPLADSSLLPAYRLCKFTRRYVKVALSGDGGDELFGGYPTYQGQLIAEKLKYLPKFVLDGTEALLNLMPNSFENYPKKDLARILIKSVKLNPVDRQLFMMRSFFRGENVIYKKPEDSWLDEILPDIGNLYSPTKTAQIVDFYTYLVDDFLVKTDRASMYNSLEVRVPYLDNDIIDYAFSTNVNHLNIFQTKILSRKLFKEKIPDLPDIANRPKKGFGIPIAKWLRGELKGFAYTYINNKKLYDHIPRKKIENMWNLHQDYKQNNAGSIWMLVVLSAWMDNWL